MNHDGSLTIFIDKDSGLPNQCCSLNRITNHITAKINWLWFNFSLPKELFYFVNSAYNAQN